MYFQGSSKVYMLRLCVYTYILVFICNGFYGMRDGKKLRGASHNLQIALYKQRQIVEK